MGESQQASRGSQPSSPPHAHCTAPHWWVCIARAVPGGGIPVPPPGAMPEARIFPSFSCTVFAFGQTGSGKTYTLMGPLTQVQHCSPPDLILMVG